jgi:hypothetical protein
MKVFSKRRKQRAATVTWYVKCGGNPPHSRSLLDSAGKRNNRCSVRVDRVKKLMINRSKILMRHTNRCTIPATLRKNRLKVMGGVP